MVCTDNGDDPMYLDDSRHRYNGRDRIHEWQYYNMYFLEEIMRSPYMPYSKEDSRVDWWCSISDHQRDMLEALMCSRPSSMSNHYPYEHDYRDKVDRLLHDAVSREDVAMLNDMDEAIAAC